MQDDWGQIKRCTFTVVVIHDTKPPRLDCPQDGVKGWFCGNPAGGPGAVVNYSVKATDDCDPSPKVVCNPPSGTFFPPGTTTVICEARDQCGNISRCEFPVIVIQDTTPPVITCPPDELFAVVVEAGTKPPPTPVSYPPPTVTDDCDKGQASFAILLPAAHSRQGPQP